MKPRFANEWGCRAALRMKCLPASRGPCRHQVGKKSVKPPLRRLGRRCCRILIRVCVPSAAAAVAYAPGILVMQRREGGGGGRHRQCQPTFVFVGVPLRSDSEPTNEHGWPIKRFRRAAGRPGGRDRELWRMTPRCQRGTDLIARSPSLPRPFARPLVPCKNSSL